MLISVVIPIYNAQDTIIKCVQSVLNQTYKEIEIILVDDGSKDDSIKIIKDWLAANYSGFISVNIFIQKNSGPSAARNKGVELSKGEFIAFLDSDDYWRLDKLEIQVECIKKNDNLGIVCSSMKKSLVSGNLDFAVLSFNKALWSNPFYTSSIIVKKRILEKFKFNENQKYSEDYRLYMEILRFYPCIKITDPLFHYMHNSRSTSLSSKLWAMEKGEISNFCFFYKKKYISFFRLVLVTSFSFIRFFRRLLMKLLN